uniref:Vomeronasal type-1 receptor n=1 Tax=Nannospalax galili TaxID=1026970 RepID=A0A4Y1N6D1_NANGA|nr:vomeronasal type 1 receptor 19 [Nannospalax galili]AWV50239.1 vomeronasal type 1 receptor 19 [Nannospalax galili]AWV50245.1 vomeronasal type 1 receptor 19 [Nannospalax galili]AWV50249.1 vomeronasal type 1 receptor 19 [Nannospalax galili]AWV50253.1 vomeronasal type 1 receptor 19 [Nannospalax galili]
MFLSDPISGIFLISEIFKGLIGNLLLFILYLYTFLTQTHPRRPVDMIFAHLTLVNVLSIVFRLLPDVMSSFAVRLYFRDAGCKAVLYAYSVTRGLSICIISLLSVFQAITVSSSHSRWAWLKSKLASCIFPSFLFIWIINIFLYFPMIENVKAQINLTVDSRYSYTYCGRNQVRYYTTVSLLSAMMIRDILFVVLMMWTSLYMVNFLLRHRRRTEHVHSSSLTSQSSSEKKATHSILLLVGFFVFLYCSNSFVTIYLFYRPKKNTVLDKISGILSSCYPVTCPYVLMNNRKVISKCISSFSNFKFTLPTRGYTS